MNCDPFVFKYEFEAFSLTLFSRLYFDPEHVVNHQLLGMDLIQHKHNLVRTIHCSLNAFNQNKRRVFLGYNEVTGEKMYEETHDKDISPVIFFLAGLRPLATRIPTHQKAFEYEKASSLQLHQTC